MADTKVRLINRLGSRVIRVLPTEVARYEAKG